MLTWQTQFLREGHRDRWSAGEPHEESRQHYATTRVQEYQRVSAAAGEVLTFEDLRGAFIYAGKEYDQGVRLRDKEAA